MAELRLEDYKGKDLYSDGDVENTLLEMARDGVAAEQPEQAEFPVLYHFSKIRENILNWYPFAEGAACLEIGSGCGALTGLLCSRMKRVVSVELSRRRAEVNFARHRDSDNLQIRVGNLNDMQFDAEFDYVILNGVFEYAAGFTPGEDPYGTFLKNIRRFLKPDGVILVAIENRLGLKYFAGAPEDHTNRYFDGVRGYEEDDGVRTFSHGEWEELMERCGLAHYRFYYPYPDYKFPQEIFTDDSLKEQKYGRPTWNFTEYRLALFRETQMAAALSAEGVMARFANSFLIEMSAVPLKNERVVRYAKLSTDRAPRFSIMTVIEERAEGRVAFKRAAGAEAETHIRNMLEQMDGSYGLWRPLAGKAEGNGIVCPFLSQKSLGQLAAEAVRRGDLPEVKRLVRKAAELCGCCEREDTKNSCREQTVQITMLRELTDAQRKRFEEVFGSRRLDADVPCIAPANIDLILDNIFEVNGTFQVIDCEWIFDFPVPVPFILWRLINELYSSQQMLETLCPKTELLQEFAIDSAMSGLFWDWATCFAEKYVGANRLLRLSTPEIGVSLEEIRQRMRAEEYLTGQLFVDTGDGFSEEQKLVSESRITDGHFSVKFDLSRFSGVQGLRFDPVEGRPCVCGIDAGCTTGRLHAANAAARTPEGDLFLTTDPMYQVKTAGAADSLTICGTIRMLSMQEVLDWYGEHQEKPRRRLPFLR